MSVSLAHNTVLIPRSPKLVLEVGAEKSASLLLLEKFVKYATKGAPEGHSSWWQRVCAFLVPFSVLTNMIVLAKPP